MPGRCFSLKLPGCFRTPSDSSKAVPYEILGDGGEDQPTTINSPTNQNGVVLDSASQDAKIPGDFVAVTAFSAEPYVEFRRSIMEVVDFRLEQRRVVNWDYLEELLSCYLELNDKRCHEDIVTAYVSVLVELCAVRSLD